MTLLTIGPLVGYFGHGYFSVFGAMLAELFPTRIRATAQGFCYNAGRVVSAAAPYTIGALAQYASRLRTRDRRALLRRRRSADLAAAGDERGGAVIDRTLAAPVHMIAEATIKVTPYQSHARGPCSYGRGGHD